MLRQSFGVSRQLFQTEQLRSQGQFAPGGKGARLGRQPVPPLPGHRSYGSWCFQLAALATAVFPCPRQARTMLKPPLHSGMEIRCKPGKTAFARPIAAGKRDRMNFGAQFHDIVHLSLLARSGLRYGVNTPLFGLGEIRSFRPWTPISVQAHKRSRRLTVCLRHTHLLSP